MKRNYSGYDFAGGVTPADADDLVNASPPFEAAAEAWITAHDPTLGK